MRDRRACFRRAFQLLMLLTYCLLLMSGLLWADEDEPARAQRGFWDILMLPRVWVGALFCLAGAVMLARARTIGTLRKLSLPLVFFAFGVFFVLPLGWFARGMGLHPSPVCTLEKPFLFVNAGREVPVIFPAILLTIAVLSVAGNKLFCGWVCPVGALQELSYEIPPTRRRKFKLPFKVTNWVRLLTFVVFVPLVLLIGKSIFDYISPFHALHWTFPVYETAVLLVVVVAGAFIFRPFCYLLCPMGLFTWLLEQLSLVRVDVDTDKCTTCYSCVDEAPCPAMEAIVDGKRIRPDCHACGKCLDTCGENAITFSGRRLINAVRRRREV